MLTLTYEQTQAKNTILDFLETDKPCMILQGFAGTGKTTILKTVYEEYHKIKDLEEIITQTKRHEWQFTALTHKAVRALMNSVNLEAETIYAYLKLHVRDNHIQGKITQHNRKHIIIIDECSYINTQLFQFIQKYTEQNPDAKIIFVGDKYQLPPVGHDISPIYQQNYPMVELTQSVRQQNSPYIAEVCGLLRQSIDTGEILPFKPKENIHFLERKTFKKHFLENAENQSIKFLSFTNSKAVQYNKICMEKYLGRRWHEAGDWVILNQYDPHIPKDTELQIKEILTYQDIKFYKFQDHTYALQVKDDEPNKLTKSYACTIHKAQGQTYDDVYIDLSDLRHIYQRDERLTARLLYVAFSRAKNNIYLTGDIA